MRIAGIARSFEQSEQQALIEWASKTGRIVASDFIEQFKPVSSGAEHVVFHDAENALAIKSTHPNRYGHSVRREGAKATPLEYFQRLWFHNLLFGDQIKVIGITCSEENIEVITCQPWINACLTSPKPTQVEIDAYFEALKFKRVDFVEDVPLYYSQEYGILVADAHDKNILRTESGPLAPIDFVVGVPEIELRQKLLRFIRDPSSK